MFAERFAFQSKHLDREAEATEAHIQVCWCKAFIKKRVLILKTDGNINSNRRLYKFTLDAQKNVRMYRHTHTHILKAVRSFKNGIKGGGQDKSSQTLGVNKTDSGQPFN